MNVYEFINGAIFFILCKIEHSSQREAELNRMFYLLTNENNRTIERIEKHLFYSGNSLTGNLITQNS